MKSVLLFVALSYLCLATTLVSVSSFQICSWHQVDLCLGISGKYPVLFTPIQLKSRFNNLDENFTSLDWVSDEYSKFRLADGDQNTFLDKSTFGTQAMLSRAGKGTHMNGTMILRTQTNQCLSIMRCFATPAGYCDKTSDIQVQSGGQILKGAYLRFKECDETSPAQAFEIDPPCARNCTADLIGDGICNKQCYTKECYFDRGDCNTTAPTLGPTLNPTVPTVQVPTIPTTLPTTAPTKMPTKTPTKTPTDAPSSSPVKSTTNTPTNLPTKQPTTPLLRPTPIPTILQTIPIPASTKSPTEARDEPDGVTIPLDSAYFIAFIVVLLVFGAFILCLLAVICTYQRDKKERQMEAAAKKETAALLPRTSDETDTRDARDTRRIDRRPDLPMPGKNRRSAVKQTTTTTDEADAVL